MSASNAIELGRWRRRLREQFESAVARRQLRGCTRLGNAAVTDGAPLIYNRGRLVVGNHFRISSTPVRSHIYVTETGEAKIGERVRIGSGAAISCLKAVEIGDDVAVGDLVIMMDSDFHVAGDFHAAAQPRPVRIGQGVRIGHRVVVLPGSTIGDGAVVRAGSVVSGVVPEGVTVEGNPARVQGAVNHGEPSLGSTEEDVCTLIMRVLALPKMPDVTSGPAEIPQWDSLGALRVVIALEESFGVALAEDQLKVSRSIADLVKYIDTARFRGPPAALVADP